MANATAKQLSEVIGISVDKLLDQLIAAGVKVADADDPISDEDKLKLLESLRTSHGKAEEGVPKKITLKRKSKSELKVSGVSGRNATTKTINVEVRKKRTFAHPLDVEPEIEVLPVVDVEAKSVTDVEAKLVADVEAKSVTDVEAKLVADVEAKSIADVEAKSIAYVEAKSIADVEAKSVADVESKSVADVEAKSVADVEAKSVADVEAKSVVDVEAKSVVDVEAKSVADVEAKLVADVEAKLVADVEAKSVADVEAKLVADVEAKLVADVEAKLVADEFAAVEIASVVEVLEKIVDPVALAAAEKARLIIEKEHAEAEKQAYSKSLQEVEAAQGVIVKQMAAAAALAAEEAAKAALEKASRAAAVTVANAEKNGKSGKRGDDKGTRYGRKELHVKLDGKQGAGGRKKKFKKSRKQFNDPDNAHGFAMPTSPIIRNVEISDSMTVGELAQKMAVKAGDVVKALMQMGSMSTINQILDVDTATLVVEEMGHNVISVVTEDDFENKLFENVAESSEEAVSRPPVVTIMGHVDHGKTSLLDYIRKSRVTSGEAGGITQHIGAYHVETDHGMITFLDTPGHAAFSAMRARGAQATDIVVLVVAADDGVMPQTREAIDHARAANVPLVIAVNKMDKENADSDRVKNELAALEVIPEDWGGENMFIDVSAITGDGVEKLLESILLQSELLELTAPNIGSAKGIVVEATLDKGRGPVATILVQSGELKKGQLLLAGTQYGRVRCMYDELSKAVDTAGPSIPIVVLGLSGVPNAGDEVFVVENERKAREFAQARESKIREAKLTDQHKTKLQGIFDAMTEGEISEVNVLIKADVHGSAEAIREALQKLSTDEVRANIISCGVGGLSESDINLAAASSAMVVGFNVRADNAAKRAAESGGVDIRYYSIIYEVIDIVKAAMSGMLAPESRENILGLATVKEVYSSPKFGDVAGSMVVDGVVRKGFPIRVLRDNVVIYEGELESLRRFKDAVEEVRMGTDCGIAVKNYNDVHPGDQIEVFERVEIVRSLA